MLTFDVELDRVRGVLAQLVSCGAGVLAALVDPDLPNAQTAGVDGHVLAARRLRVDHGALKEKYRGGS